MQPEITVEQVKKAYPRYPERRVEILTKLLNNLDKSMVDYFYLGSNGNRTRYIFFITEIINGEPKTIVLNRLFEDLIDDKRVKIA